MQNKKTTNNIDARTLIKKMTDETWKDQYKQWKNLKPYEIKLIDDGPKSQSQAWLLNSMWCEWMNLKKNNVTDGSIKDSSFGNDPWEI